ncbi:copper resistance CopC family protein [Thioalkalivibrio sulfidiphilus]|uniref:copper resistance CopC family protein n=1 Tax=Thioalkalivibrio sulfidiphilus TaxID=1033854 RepID=UPI00036E776D|nr:copper resistance CopC family protein [Thioalkalivibrio sulfidiphilus]
MSFRHSIRFIGAFGITLLLFTTSPVWAHAQQEGMYPEHASTIEGSPEKIAVWFDHAMRLTLFEVTGPQGRVELQSRPGRETVTRFETAPAGPLVPGEYTVKWRGLAEDGHVMFDEFYFTVR